jgi:serine/threonine-protein kinase
MIGRVLGDRYRVLSRLGEGGMGTVYLCEHAVLRRRFALKVLRPELADDPELVERFRNEAIAASRIGQENVVDVVDFGAEEDGALYYVMEALDGRSVGAILRDEGPLPVHRVLLLIEQACRALAAAHARGVVHRDVKPENVFVVRRDDAERVKILDFGISHVPSEMTGARLTRAGSIIGTPEYMAPEQATGEDVDHRADVYAVGVLAYEMLTGMLPIEASTAIATLVAAQSRAPEPPSKRRTEVPAEVDHIVLKALAKKPGDRFPSMIEFAAEVARVRVGIFGGGFTPFPERSSSPTMRYEPPPSRRSSRPAQRTLAVGEDAAAAYRPTLPSGVVRAALRRPGLARAGVVLAAFLAVAAAAAIWILKGPAAPTPGAAPAAARAPEAIAQPAAATALPAEATAQPAAATAQPAASTARPAEGTDRPAPADGSSSAVAPAAPSDSASPDPRPAARAAGPARPPAHARQSPPPERPQPAKPEKDPYGDGDLKPDPFR